MVEKSLNPAPKSADVQGDNTQNTPSVKDVEKQLAPTSIDGQDQNEVGNSSMEIDLKDASTPKLFRYRVQGKWVGVPKMDGAMVKQFIRFFKEGLSK